MEVLMVLDGGHCYPSYFVGVEMVSNDGEVSFCQVFH